MTLAKPSWYVGCSPRDPKKLLPELKLLLAYDGKVWTKKEQTLFAKSLAKLDTFEGEGYNKELGFSTRDRVAKMKTYGFVYTTKTKGKDILHITNAGRMILSTSLPEEVFLKQMLKWQYPSYQHRNENQYPADKFNIRPFIFTTKLIYALEGMSKSELSIFAFTTTDENEADSVIKEVKKYRAKRENISGKTKKLQFDDDYQRKRFKEAYSEFIGGWNDKVDAELNKKMRNSVDMADAMIRHLRFTPLFTINGNRIVVSKNMKNVVEGIISEPIKLNKDYADRDKFYAYMGNPEIPLTELDDKARLVHMIESAYEEIKIISKKVETKSIEIKKKADILALSVFKMKELLFGLLNEKQKLLALLLGKEIRKEDAKTEIITMFQKIVEREVIDPATYLEWNMWRALLHIDDEERIVPNFKMDADLQPINNAGGKKGDIEAYYNSFNLLVEVTLTYGQRQADKEIEPVWRHVGNFQQGNKGKKTFGLFVAPKIDSATPLDFFVRASHPLFNGEKIIIIPLTLAQFVEIMEIIEVVKENRSKRMYQLWDLFEKEINSAKHKDGDSWNKSFPQIIQNWKKELISSAISQ